MESNKILRCKKRRLRNQKKVVLCNRCTGSGKLPCLSCEGHRYYIEGKKVVVLDGERITLPNRVDCFCGNGARSCPDCRGQGHWKE